jgi:hypothetical protein
MIVSFVLGLAMAKGTMDVVFSLMTRGALNSGRGNTAQIGV